MAGFEDRLRTALHSSAQAVTTDPATWQEVQRRIRRRQYTVWAAPAAAVAVVALAAVVALPQLPGMSGADEVVEFAPADVGTMADEAAPEEQRELSHDDAEAEAESDDAVLSPPPEAEEDAAETSGPPEGATTVTTYLVRWHDGHGYVEPYESRLDEPTMAVGRAAIEMLLALPAGAEALETTAPTDVEVRGASIDHGVFVVDLSEEVLDGPGGSANEQLFAQQLAHTAAQFDNVESLRLLVDGEPIDELWGHLDWSEPIEPAADMLAPVVVDEVAVDADSGAVAASGWATTYEGTLIVRLRYPDGEAYTEGHTTADCGAPCRGAWSIEFELPNVPPGTWVLEVSEPRVTDEGREPFTAEAAFEVE